MNVKERDELLIRLDERSNNTWRTVEEIKKHVEKQNGKITKNRIAIAVLFALLAGSGLYANMAGVISLFGG